MKLSAALIAALGAASNACLLPEELQAEEERRAYGFSTTRRSRPNPLAARARPDFPIGQGDRFGNGSVVPKGLGLDDRDLESVLSVREVGSGLQALADAYDELELFTAPHATYEKRQLQGATLGKDPRVFIMSGIHARERGGPDDVLYFISDLLHAKEAGVGLKYGDVAYTSQDVVTALDTGIVFIPLVNPDGVVYDQETDLCWRKNRNPKSSKRPQGDDVGIDLNRNFDFLFDYLKVFNPDANIQSTASDNPGSEVFHGTGPFSEPETQNVAWVMDELAPNVSWFLDLHSFGGSVLYGWGDDNMQTNDTAQNFADSKFDGKRGFIGKDPADSRYREYVTVQDLESQRGVSERMSAAMGRAGPTPWKAEETVLLYPTSGASTDYALSRYYGHKCGATKTYGVTVEFGQSSGSAACPFYPSAQQYHDWMREVSVGLMEFLLQAAEEGGKIEKWEC